MTDVREKLAELIYNNSPRLVEEESEILAKRLIANGVTVQEHEYLETVVEVKDNTVCGNGVKIEYKRCSCCKKTS